MEQDIREKIIVSADDFGISALANERILELIRKGKIDRVAVMMDGDGSLNADYVAALLASNIAIDIHLNSIKKITPDRKLSEPIFPRIIGFCMKLLRGDARPSVMEKKWVREIDQFRSLFGKTPDGISAHEYVYFFPAYFRVVVRLARQSHIPYVRFGTRGMIRSRSGVYRILQYLWKINRESFEESGMQSSTYWVSLDWIQDVQVFMDSLPEGKTELVVHPERDEEAQLIDRLL